MDEESSVIAAPIVSRRVSVPNGAWKIIGMRRRCLRGSRSGSFQAPLILSNIRFAATSEFLAIALSARGPLPSKSITPS